jgi:hypothetical protein
MIALVHYYLLGCVAFGEDNSGVVLVVLVLLFKGVDHCSRFFFFYSSFFFNCVYP